jgi:hypothetical protein
MRDKLGTKCRSMDQLQLDNVAALPPKKPKR